MQATKQIQASEIENGTILIMRDGEPAIADEVRRCNGYIRYYSTREGRAVGDHSSLPDHPITVVDPDRVTLTLTKDDAFALGDAIQAAMEDKEHHLDNGGWSDYSADDRANMAAHWQTLQRISAELGLSHLAERLGAFVGELTTEPSANCEITAS